METIKLKFNDFRIIPDFNSVHREAISDEVYFSSKYAKFLSNSRLKWINPVEGGSPLLFQSPPKQRSTALNLGSAIHEAILQPEDFELAPKIDKPTAKLGMVMDEIDRSLHSKRIFDSFDDLIIDAALKVDYYTNSINSKLDSIKSVWNEYGPVLDNLRRNSNKEIVTLSNNDWDIATACINSLRDNTEIMSKIHPTDVFGDPIESYCEDALFMDFIVVHEGSKCATLRFKLKIDNWTIDEETKTVTLNDLKTTGKSVNHFIEETGSLYNFHYYRQLGIYGIILMYYLNKTRGVTKEMGWKLKANILAVETIPNYWSRCFSIDDNLLKIGIKEAYELLKRVAACEIFGYENDFIFE